MVESRQIGVWRLEIQDEEDYHYIIIYNKKGEEVAFFFTVGNVRVKMKTSTEVRVDTL